MARGKRDSAVSTAVERQHTRTVASRTRVSAARMGARGNFSRGAKPPTPKQVVIFSARRRKNRPSFGAPRAQTKIFVFILCRFKFNDVTVSADGISQERST